MKDQTYDVVVDKRTPVADESLGDEGRLGLIKTRGEEHQFKRIRLARTAATPSEQSVSPAEPSPIDPQYTFSNVDSLLGFVTLRWRENWVTTDIWDDKVVDALLRRPFFLLVSVDAPVSVRWQRFRDRYTSPTPLSHAHS